MNKETGNLRMWLFRGLVIAAIALMIISFSRPWWVATFTSSLSYDMTAVNIYGWGLRHSLALLSSYVVKDATPYYQTILAWVYIGISGCLAFFSTWLKGKKGQLILGSIGVIYIVYAVITVFVVISHRVSYYLIPLQGTTQMILVSQADVIAVHSSLQAGYYLAYASGVMLIILAMFRSISGGKNRDTISS
jgi:hypothetical protein